MLKHIDYDNWKTTPPDVQWHESQTVAAIDAVNGLTNSINRLRRVCQPAAALIADQIADAIEILEEAFNI